jgi:hypothetical protein
MLDLMTRALSLSITVGFVAMSFAQTTSKPTPADPVTTLRWLGHADGKADVHRAVTDHRDTRFLGVLELGGTVPCAETPGADTLIHSHGVRWLENTSCIITSPEHLRLAKKAMAYAADYNKLLLQYLAKQKQA